jgi:hypothetical protein
VPEGIVTAIGATTGKTTYGGGKSPTMVPEVDLTEYQKPAKLIEVGADAVHFLGLV